MSEEEWQSPSDAEIAAGVAEELPVGVWVARAPGGEFTYANRTFREIMGVEARSDVAIGEYAQPYGIHHRDGHLYPEHEMPFVRAIQARSTVVVDDIVVHRPDGGRVSIRAQARPVLSRLGEVTHVVIAFIDITREVVAEKGRAEAEARTARAERLEAVGQLAGGIAHDFKNLLAAIRLVASSLRESEGDPGRMAALRQIEAAADSGAELTRSLLSFAARRPEKPTSMSPNETAAEVVELQRFAVDRRVELVTDLRALGRVAGERAALDQLVMNLVVNAREAIDGHGHVIVRTRDEALDPEAARRVGLPPGSYVVLEVEDDGPGIDASVRDRIFEPYFTTKLSAERGRGLGLATVFAVARGHGGTVEALANDPRGTVMRIWLPRLDAGDEHGSDRPAGARPALTRGRGTVLVVDDEPLVRRATASALRRLGYDVVGAADGDEAIALFREHRGAIRLVVLDMIMPRMDGPTTLRALRELDPGVRVLLTSGSATGEHDEEALALGAVGIMAKPYGLEELSVAIASAMA